jgi:hypothetical protein
MSACKIKQQALTRPKWDDFHQEDDMRITSYAMRYRLNPPAANCQTTYPVNSTIRIQKSGNSWVSGQWRTDVESDLRGINRFATKIRSEQCEPHTQFDPRNNPMSQINIENAPDENFPMAFNRLSNPPCTLRATGWNRFDYLLRNPQETFETPFDFFIPSRLIDKEKCKTH